MLRWQVPFTPSTPAIANPSLHQTMLRQWAYRYYTYPTSVYSARALPGWRSWYKRRRPHGSLGGLPPPSRVSWVAPLHRRWAYEQPRPIRRRAPTRSNIEGRLDSAPVGIADAGLHHVFEIDRR